MVHGDAPARGSTRSHGGRWCGKKIPKREAEPGEVLIHHLVLTPMYDSNVDTKVNQLVSCAGAATTCECLL
jgi:hypothetical protein